MIRVCIADNQPVVHFGVKSYFKESTEISIVGHVGNYNMILDILKIRPIDILVMDLELDGLKSLNLIKYILKEFPQTKIIIFSNLSESVYAPNALKAGAAAYLHKSSKLETLGNTIVKVKNGGVIFNDSIKKNLQLIAKQNKNERLYRKLSNREIEVLRYLSDGKKNNEISKILGLNEKTISTYKLRLLTKLNVTNLVDLVNKAKTLEIV